MVFSALSWRGACCRARVVVTHLAGTRGTAWCCYAFTEFPVILAVYLRNLPNSEKEASPCDPLFHLGSPLAAYVTTPTGGDTTAAETCLSRRKLKLPEQVAWWAACNMILMIIHCDDITSANSPTKAGGHRSTALPSVASSSCFP